MTTSRTNYSLGAILANQLKLGNKHESQKVASLLRSNLQGSDDFLKSLGLKKESQNKHKPFTQIITGFNEVNLFSERVIFITFESRVGILAQQWFSDTASIRMSGFIPLGMEYFYPIYQNIKQGRDILPAHWQSKGDIYFKGTRVVNSEGDLLIPYINYYEEEFVWRAGFKKASEIIPDTKENRRTLGICILKTCNRKGRNKRPFSERQEA